jgi:hypothetical protein
VYEYERVSLHIPRKHHELIKPFLKQDFDVSVAAEKGIIVITLTPAKTTKSNMAITEAFRLSGWDEID